MYLLELHDILFVNKFIKTPIAKFNITSYINFSSTSTRSGANNKLIPPRHLNNISQHPYFHRLPSLWNTMPVFDLNMSFNTLKSKSKKHLWEHFLNHYDDSKTILYIANHYPCCGCHLSTSLTIDFDHL